jgi:hypothetical protein
VFTLRNGFRAFFSILLAAGLVGCSLEWAHRIYPLPFYNTKVTVQLSRELVEAPPHRIAVLPFTFEQKDNPERRQAVEVLREIFDRGLRRLRSYGTVSLVDVNRRLEAAGIGRGNIEKRSSRELGAVTGADALLYGRVKRTRNITLYVYSHTVYEGTFRLVDARSGALLWSGHLWEGRRAGMIVELFLLDAFLSQPKNRELPEAYSRVATIMVEKLIATIPEPLTFAAEPPARDAYRKNR